MPVVLYFPNICPVLLKNVNYSFYNNNRNQLGIHFIICNAILLVLTLQPCQLLSVKHNQRKLKGISNLPGKNGNILHLYDDGSLFSQEVSVSPYSNNYPEEMSHNDKIIFTEPLFLKSKWLFSS